MKHFDEWLNRVAAVGTIIEVAVVIFFKDSVDPLLLVLNVAFACIILGVSFRNIYLREKSPEHRLRKMYDTYLESNPQYLQALTHGMAEQLKVRTEAAIREAGQDHNFDPGVYYILLYTLFFNAKHDIWSVSVMDDGEWIDSPEEREYLRVNLHVTEQRVHLKRIFIVSQQDVRKKLNVFQMKDFIEAQETSQYIHLYVVFKEDLDEALLHDIGSGFIAFDDFVVACDVFWNNEIRGCLFLGASDILRYKSIFMAMDTKSSPLDRNLWNEYCIANQNSQE